jgi:hypothetical protein
MTGKITRFLLIQLYSNGDCLYATVIARQLKNDFPGCYISWVVEENCKSILENNPFIDKITPVKLTDKKKTEQIISLMKKDAIADIERGVLDDFFVTHISGDNYANYDGSVRSSIYRNFPYPITVDTQVVLFLTKNEENRAKLFAEQNRFDLYRDIILFECAPMTGQSSLSDELISKIAIQVADNHNIGIVLSSYRKININHPAVFDGSVLSLRETVALSHYCTLFMGSSSGITWACTSNAAKPLPMIQLLNPNTYVFNPPSVDFKKRGKPVDNLIELYSFNHKDIIACTQAVLMWGFEVAREQFNQQPIFKFRLYRGIIHSFLLRGKFNRIAHFIRLNLKENRWHINMLLMIMKGFLFFPVQLIADKLSLFSKAKS